MKILKAEKADLYEILELQYLSYRSEAEIYNDNNIQPLKQTLMDLENEFEQQLMLKAIIDQRIIGSVRAFEKDQVCQIGKLIVHPEYQNKGIGTKLLSEIEKIFNKCRKYELFTGEKSRRNIYLYNKLGYTVFNTTEINENLKIIFLEKHNRMNMIY